MPDYQWAVGKGKIITADYDRSMALNADQVEGEVRKAFSNLFDGVVVEPISKEFKEVYKVTIPREDETQTVYEIISGCLSKEESSKLFALLTDINQLIDYMEEGLRYIHERTKGKKRISGLTSYVDSYTIGLSHSIMGKAEEVLNNRGIYEVLKKKII